MDEFSDQLKYSIDDTIIINHMSYLNNDNITIALRKIEGKFGKYGYIKPYSLRCTHQKDYSTFSINQFTSQLNKELRCTCYVFNPQKNNIYVVTVNILQANCGMRCSINDIYNKTTGEEITILSVIIPITNINIDDYKINDIITIQLLDVRNENNVKELFSIGNIIPKNTIQNIQKLKPIINSIMSNYINNIFIRHTRLLNKIIISNNHLNIIYPIKYSNNKLVFSIYEFLTSKQFHKQNLNNIDNTELDNLYIKYIYNTYEINIVDDNTIIYIDNKLDTETDTINETYDDDTDLNSEIYIDSDDDEEYNEEDEEYDEYADIDDSTIPTEIEGLNELYDDDKLNTIEDLDEIDTIAKDAKVNIKYSERSDEESETESDTESEEESEEQSYKNIK